MSISDDDIAFAVKKLKEVLGDTNDIVPGLGMMLHQLAHDILLAMAPPDGFMELQEKYNEEGKKLTQDVCEREHPEIAKAVEDKADAMKAVAEKALDIVQTNPADLCKKAMENIRTLRANKKMEMVAKNNTSEFNDDDEGVDAPMEGGWASNCKGNA